MSRKVLITGGAGFLGLHLVRRLLEQGHQVVVYDSLVSGSAENLSEFLGNPRFEFSQHDVIEPYDVEVDEVFNFACVASPPRYQRDPLHTFKTSIFGALNAAQIGTKHNAKVLQASTSEIYGEPKLSPQPESYWGNVNPIGIRSCYDEGKRGAETVLSDFGRMHGTDVRIARIFNTYGPRMRPDDGRVVSNFIVQALTGKPLSIFGTGSQTRSFCYVDDLITGLVALMRHKGPLDGPVNLGNPHEFTVLELAKLVLEQTGSRSKLEFHPLPGDDPTQRRPDISKAQRLLNWAPSTPLEQGLKTTIDYFDKYLSGAKLLEEVMG